MPKFIPKKHASPINLTNMAQGLFGSVPVHKVIPYERTMDIRNTEQLARGTGGKFLEVISGEGKSLIAKQWRRKLPKTGGTFVEFGGK